VCGVCVCVCVWLCVCAECVQCGRSVGTVCVRCGRIRMATLHASE